MTKSKCWLDLNCTIEAFIGTESTDLHRPVTRVVFRLLAAKSRDIQNLGARHGDEAWWSKEHGMFAVKIRRHAGDGELVYLRAAESDPVVYESAVPQPRCRAIDVRWRYGRWEKLLKRKGWVPIG